MRAIHKRYLRSMLAASVAYLALIGLFVVLVPHVRGVVWRSALALLPLPAVIAIIRAVARLVREEDELEQRIDLESFAIAAVFTGFGFFSYGLLLSVGALPHAPAFLVATLVLPTVFVSYGLAKWAVSRRYARK
jgi:hypothetical protein